MTSQLAIRSLSTALDQNYVLILTSNQTEKDAVNAQLVNARPAKVDHNQHGCRLGQIGSRPILHLTGTSGAQTPLSVARLARAVVKPGMPRPALVLLVGFGWGDPDRTSIGQVMVATRVLAFNHRRVAAKTETYRTQPYVSSLFGLEAEIVERLKTRPDLTGLAVHGAILSAETHVGRTTLSRKLIRENPEAIGGDMEAYDLVPELDVPWLVIKGVSDAAANNTDTAEQKLAASHAAKTLPDMLTILEDVEALQPPRDDDHALYVLDILMGKTVHVSLPPPNVDGLNTYLEDTVAPQLERRISQYPDSSSAFITGLTTLLLEIAQNAIRHGNASAVHVDFEDGAIILRDDGATYELADLLSATRPRGGSAAWGQFCAEFIDTKRVEYSRRTPKRQGNIYRFKLSYISLELVKARQHCSVSIGSYDRARGDGLPTTLHYDERCEVLYVEVKTSRMISSRMNLVREIDALLVSGKRVFLSCRDSKERALYADQLSHWMTGKLTILDGSKD